MYYRQWKQVPYKILYLANSEFYLARQQIVYLRKLSSPKGKDDTDTGLQIVSLIAFVQYWSSQKLSEEKQKTQQKEKYIYSLLLSLLCKVKLVDADSFSSIYRYYPQYFSFYVFYVLGHDNK